MVWIRSRTTCFSGGVPIWPNNPRNNLKLHFNQPTSSQNKSSAQQPAQKQRFRLLWPAEYFGCFPKQRFWLLGQGIDNRAACLTAIKQYSFVYQNCSLGKDSLFQCKSVSEENIALLAFVLRQNLRFSLLLSQNRLYYNIGLLAS